MEQLQDLLERSKTLSAQQQQSTEYHGVTLDIVRPLPLLQKQTQQMLRDKSHAAVGANEEQAAQILFAQKGINLNRIKQSLQAVSKSASAAFQSVQMLRDTDVGGYAALEHEQLILNSLSRARKDIEQIVAKTLKASRKKQWDTEKQQVSQLMSASKFVQPPPSQTPFKGAQGMAGKKAQQQSQAPQSIATYSVNKSGIVNPDLLTPRTAKGSGVPVQSTAGIATDDPVMAKLLSYAQTLIAVEEQRLMNRPVPVFKLFKDALLRLNGPFDEIVQCWDLLQYIVGENGSGGVLARDMHNAPRERQFARGYGQPGSAIDGQIVQGSRKWLESYFRVYLERAVVKCYQNKDLFAVDGLEQARIASQVGRMSVSQKVTMWIQDVLMPRSDVNLWEIVDNQAIWVAIFYLLRAGEYREALQFAARFENHFMKTSKKFLDYLEAWVSSPGHVLPAKLRSELMVEYNSNLRDSAMRNLSASFHMPQMQSRFFNEGVDPYKYLVYRVLGQIVDFDVMIPPHVVQGLAGGVIGWEDELWIQLMLVSSADGAQFAQDAQSPFQSGSQKGTPEVYSLDDLYQKYVAKISVEQWTENSSHVYRYFMVLIACGQFERAVMFLFNLQDASVTPSSQIDAVHFAISLLYYGLLSTRTSFDEDSALTLNSDENQRSKVDLLSMVNQFIYGILNPSLYAQEAVHYVIILFVLLDGYTGSVSVESNNSNEQHINRLRQMLTGQLIDLVINSGKIEELFGTFALDQQLQRAVRNAGYLDRYAPLIGMSKDDVKSCLIKPSARKCVQSDVPLEVAIALFNLAEDFDAVLNLLSKRLSGELKQCNVDAVVQFSVGQASGAVKTSNVVGRIDALVDAYQMTSSVVEFYQQEWIAVKIKQQSKETVQLLMLISQLCMTVQSLVEDFDLSMCAELVRLINSLPLVPMSDDMNRAGGDGSGETSYVAIQSQAEQIRRDFSDVVLVHLPLVFCIVEAVYLIIFQAQRRQQLSLGINVGKRSRELMSFVALVGRWFKIDSSLRAQLMNMEEMIN
ncbi:hypothetical protein MIR68_005324 [Amoeboaphelidium protococcarum]|nr:hypothetical protein MIR68_005324 [Amoeboaphelidium protococcarum]